MNLVPIAQAMAKFIEKLLLKRGFVLIRSMQYLSRERTIDLFDRPWEYVRLCSLELAAHEIISANVEGAIAEVGVYRGTFAKVLNEAFPDRKLYLFDTFEGFDERDVALDQDRGLSEEDRDFSDTSIDFVLARMSRPEDCIIKKGYFPDTANGLDEKFAFVSLDVDLYKPTIDGLEYFYPRLQPGGYIFVHDYNFDEFRGPKEAVHNFARNTGVPYFPLCDPCGTVVIAKGLGKTES